MPIGEGAGPPLVIPVNAAKPIWMPGIFDLLFRGPAELVPVERCSQAAGRPTERAGLLTGINAPTGLPEYRSANRWTGPMPGRIRTGAWRLKPSLERE